MQKLLFLAAFLLNFASATFAQQTVDDSLVSDGILRYYHVYLPKNYTAGVSMPVVIHLHGYGSNGLLEKGYTNYMPVADTAGFICVYPEGRLDQFQRQYWYVGLIGQPIGPDDVLFISDLIDALHSKYNINRSKVYASGLSNGGYMCYQLAWKLSNKIAAIASVSGSMMPLEFSQCQPVEIVPVMEIHGTADDVVPYTKSVSTTDIDTLMNFWVLADHCIPLPGITNLPDISPLDGTTVIHSEWSAELANTACELYKIIGGAHVDWPGAGVGNNMDFSASPTIWQFFNRYQNSQAAVNTKPGHDSFSFYPNPCSETLHISSSTECIVSIIDVTGRTILNSTESVMDVSRLPAGCYQLEFEANGVRHFERMIKL